MALWLHGLVAAVLVFQATGSTSMVALATVAQFAPQFLLAPLAGTWADRGRVAPQIVCGRLLCATGSGFLALWMLFTDGLEGRGGALLVVIASLILGVGIVTGGPAMHSVAPLLVSRAELPTALALNTAPPSVGRVIGPALAAALMTTLGPVLALSVAACGHLSFALIMLAIPVSRAQKEAEATADASADRSMRAAVAHVRRDRPLAILLMTVTALGLAAEPVQTLSPALARQLGGDVGTVGALTTGFGLGAMLGMLLSSALARRMRHTHQVASCVALLATSMTACAITPGLNATLCALFTAGFGYMVALTSVSTLVQLRIPQELRGRVMAMWTMGFLGSRPLAALVVGSVADLASVRVAFLVVAVVLVAVLPACRPRNLR